MEKLGKDAIILTNKEFETIRKYKKIENLAKKQEKEEKDDYIIRLILFIFVPIAIFTLINFIILCNIYELLEKCNILS